MKTFFAVLTITLLSFSVFADNHSVMVIHAVVKVKGTVLDKLTKETLSGVVIRVDDRDTKIYSDKNGEFIVEGLTPGTYTLNISSISYKQQTIEVTLGKLAEDTLSVQLESVEP